MNDTTWSAAQFRCDDEMTRVLVQGILALFPGRINPDAAQRLSDMLTAKNLKHI